MNAIRRKAPAVLWVLASLAVVVVAGANVSSAFIFPLELEVREGTSWLHVLTIEAGISLYDHTRVAYLNMNHGPMDAILKVWIHGLLPFLTPAMVTRIFVLLLPFGLFLALHRALRSHWMVAVACAGTLYLFLLGLAPPHFLIGRSDPAALFFLALTLVAGDAAVRCTAGWGGRLGSVALAGVLSVITFLINWRFLPIMGLLAIGWTVEGIVAHRGHRIKWVALNAGGFITAFFLTFLVVLFTVFHGEFPLYFSHFFGFFLPGSGWGAGQGDAFALFPAALRPGRWVMHGLLAVLFCLAAARPDSRLRRSVQLGAWLPVLAGLWVTLAVSYFLNQAGGDIYYFAPFYVVAAWHLARTLDGNALSGSVWALALPLCLLGAVPWNETWAQARNLRTMLPAARNFLAETQRLTGGRPIRSEALFLYETRYAGEVIDMGDVVYRSFTISNGYYGVDFEETARRYFDSLKTNPPEFVMLGSLTVVSPPLFELVSQTYVQILQAPPHLLGNHSASSALYQRRPPVPAPK
ncbi:MAG: hypothetical protein RL324_1943 [Verrucomicrobiota bacterium]|jgi:hypothetical protein